MAWRNDAPPMDLRSLILGASCPSSAAPASDVSVSVVQVARVDLIEAGIRAVTSPSGLLYVQTRLCPGAGDGTYWIEAGETCGGLCGHGGTYVLEEKDGTWASTGSAPGTGSWIS